MKKSLVVLTAVVSLLSFTTQALGCASSSYSQIYAAQYDIPSTYDLAIGKLPIHSNAYYNFIIQSKLEKMQNNSITLDEYDDLAVAYNKIGEKQKAIDLLLPIVKDNPTRFSSVSNLGSTYLNMGDYDNGLKYLRIANTLKPIDSYDREYAQEKVYSYLKERNKIPPYSFPIQDIDSGKNFADFALKNIPLEKQNDEIIRLIFGIENMVRFGNHDSPVSMEVLGDLFLRFKDNNNLTVYEIDEHIEDFYDSAYFKSTLKNEYSLKKIQEKNESNSPEVKYLASINMAIGEPNLEKAIERVKEERIILEKKEKQIILEGKDVEKKLNENLLNESNNDAISVLQEKERLYNILKTKEKEITVNNYLTYIQLSNILAWLLFGITLMISLYIILERYQSINKISEFKKEEFSFLNKCGKYMKKSLIGVFTLGCLLFVSSFFINSQFEFMILVVVGGIIISSIIFIISFLISAYLLSFHKYKSNNFYHLKIQTNLKRTLILTILAIVLLIITNLSKFYIDYKYNYMNKYDNEIITVPVINQENLRNVN